MDFPMLSKWCTVNCINISRTVRSHSEQEVQHVNKYPQRDRPSFTSSWNSKSVSLPFPCVMWLMVAAASSFALHQYWRQVFMLLPPHAEPGVGERRASTKTCARTLEMSSVMDADVLSLSSSSSFPTSSAAAVAGTQQEESAKDDGSLPQSPEEHISTKELWFVYNRCIPTL